MLTQRKALALHAFSLILLVPICCNEKPTKSISFSERSIDFGQKKLGDTLHHIFKIMNEGSKNLLIKSVETSCTCTLGNWTSNPIPPDSSGEVSVQMIVRDTGFVKRSVVVETNQDSILYPLTISVTGYR